MQSCIIGQWPPDRCGCGCTGTRFYRTTHHCQITADWRAAERIGLSVLRTKWIGLCCGIIDFATERVRLSHVVLCGGERSLGCCSWIGRFGGEGVGACCRSGCCIVQLGCKQVRLWSISGGTERVGWGWERVFWGEGGARGLCEESVCSKGIGPFEWISSKWIWWNQTAADTECLNI